MELDPEKKTPRIRYLTRREVLSLMGSTAAALALAGCGGSEQSGSGESTSSSTAETTSGATAETASTCLVRPEQTEGPYFVDEMLNRSDIGEDREGVPLDLTFNVSRVDEGDVSACGPLAGAVVDIWHADAAGQYSDVQDNAEGFDTRGGDLPARLPGDGRERHREVHDDLSRLVPGQGRPHTFQGS